MQSQVDSLISHTLDRFSTVPPNERLLIGIAGMPGSGKTTLAARVVDGLNARLGTATAAMIPMDGYHLTRAALSAMPDPERAHFCRGAHWTFAPAELAALVRACKAPLAPAAAPLYAASFDHARKDPVADDIPILPSHRILVFEGNYLALAEPPEWRRVADLFDERWFVRVDEAVAKERLAKRHLAAGIVGTYEEGVARAEGNDLVNGRYLADHMVPVERMVESVEEEGWAA